MDQATLHRLYEERDWLRAELAIGDASGEPFADDRPTDDDGPQAHLGSQGEDAQAESSHRRQNGDDRLRNNSSSDTARGLDAVCAADIIQEPVEWIRLGWLAVGKITLLGGDPGLGKSQIASDIETRITRSMAWPDGGKAPSGSVVILSSEDGAADTIVPRLDLVGADLRRVHIVRSVLDKGKARTFSLQNDLDQLGKLITKIGDVALLRIDPITSYMGSDIDSHRTTDVRSVLEPVATFAEQMKIAVLAITHPPKATQAKALHAFTGSLAYVAAARMAFVVIKEPESGRSLLLQAKNNLGPLVPGVGYRIVQGITAKGIVSSHVIWDTAPVLMTADEAVHASANGHRRGGEQRDAEQFLRDLLAKGPVPADEGLAAAQKEGISERTLKRARQKLCVVAAKDGFTGGWTWMLP